MVHNALFVAVLCFFVISVRKLDRPIAFVGLFVDEMSMPFRFCIAKTSSGAFKSSTGYLDELYFNATLLSKIMMRVDVKIF